MILFKRIVKLTTALMWVLGMSVASAEVVVVVSAKSTVSGLSDNQVANIFLGKASRLPNGDRAVPVDQSDGTRTRDEFYQKLVGKSPAQVKAHWSKAIFTGKGQPPKEVGDSKATRRAVAGNPDFIGYIDSSAIDQSVKAVLLLP